MLSPGARMSDESNRAQRPPNRLVEGGSRIPGLPALILTIATATASATSTNVSAPATNDTVNDVQFSTVYQPIVLQLCLSPTVENCTFVAGGATVYGIADNALG